MDNKLGADIQVLTAYELVRLGKTTITVGGLGAAILIVVASLVAGQLLAGVIRRIRRRADPNAAPWIKILEKMTNYSLAVFGVIAAF